MSPTACLGLAAAWKRSRKRLAFHYDPYPLVQLGARREHYGSRTRFAASMTQKWPLMRFCMRPPHSAPKVGGRR